MGNLHPVTKKLDGSEILSDVPDLLLIGTTAQQAFSGFDATKATALDWGTALGVGPTGLAHDALAAYDTLHAAPITLDAVVGVLGLTTTGPLGLLAAFGKKLAGQIASP